MPLLDSRSAARGHRALALLVAALNALGTVWIIALMLLVCADIALRTLAAAPIAGVAEMVAFSIVGIVFLQLAHTLRNGALTRSDLVLDLLARRAPRLRRLLLCLFDLTGAGMIGLTLWFFLPSLADAWARPERNFMGNPGFFRVPTWPLYLLMATGMAATVAQFVASALADLHGVEPGDRP
ncbi:TRAP transporter small permease subunit [Azospirillum sp. ST 5-10]|uniref:TRAP transporter small permease subunit n=1 Tax=unclassified Azospirillum TaxID=2630922 RepID=UPI003F4A0064